MRTYNVILSVGVDLEYEVEAENEQIAREEALMNFSRSDLDVAIQDAEFYSTTDPDIVEVYAIAEENEDEDDDEFV